MARTRPAGMKAFTLVWLGQVISLTGTAMTAFAISVWAWKTTGSATDLSMVAFFNFAPTIIMCPVAGALVDRWNRKLSMAVSDIMSGIGTLIMLVLYIAGHLEIWHLCVLGLLSGTFQAFQWPAYQAAISTMMPKEQYGRASGMMAVAQNGSGIIAPLIAGAVVDSRGLMPVFAFDIVSLCVALALLGYAEVPRPQTSSVGTEAHGSLWKETVFGWQYIVARRPLLWLQLSFFVCNLLSSVCLTLWNPMILARTNDSSRILGIVNTVSAIGGVAGGAIMTAWGGPRRRIAGVLCGMVLLSILGIMLMGLGRTLPVWLVSGFLGSFIVPLVNGSNDAIWQSKVPHDVQGKVFGTRMMIAQVSVPISMLVAGPLADRVFEPAMMPGGKWAPIFGSLTGVGRGAGMALMYVCFGAASLAVAVAGSAVRDVRCVETLLPDYVPYVGEEPVPVAREPVCRATDEA